jgi:hypothetical protein
MPPIVRLVGGGEPCEEVFISLERTLIAMADVRSTLPQLQKELRRKWPVEHVRIETRIPRLRNPYDPSQVLEAACVGLVVSFTLPAVRAASRKVGEAIGDEIAKYVRRWIRSIGNPRPTRHRGSTRVRQTRSRR